LFQLCHVFIDRRPAAVKSAVAKRPVRKLVDTCASPGGKAFSCLLIIGQIEAQAQVSAAADTPGLPIQQAIDSQYSGDTRS